MQEGEEAADPQQEKTGEEKNEASASPEDDKKPLELTQRHWFGGESGMTLSQSGGSIEVGKRDGWPFYGTHEYNATIKSWRLHFRGSLLNSSLVLTFTERPMTQAYAMGGIGVFKGPSAVSFPVPPKEVESVRSFMQHHYGSIEGPSC